MGISLIGLEKQIDPLTLLALANTCVAAIRRGTELYKQVKGTINDAQKTYNEVKTITKEVGGFFGLFTKTVEVQVPIEPRGTESNKKSKVVADENSVYTELAQNLAKLFRLQEQLENILRQEEIKSKSVYDQNQNLMESALNRVLIQSQMDKLSEEVHKLLIWESPPELGALYTKCHEMRTHIIAEQDYARNKIEKKKRDAQRKKEQMVSKMQDNLIYFVAVTFVLGMLAFIWWVIVMDRKARYGW